MVQKVNDPLAPRSLLPGTNNADVSAWKQRAHIRHEASKFASHHQSLFPAHSVLIVGPGSTTQCQLFGPTQSMPFRDGFDPWRLAGEGFHVRKVPFVYTMFPVALRSSYSHAPGNEELVEQEDNISILPRVAAYPGAPMDRTELSALDIPLVTLCELSG